MKGMKLEYEKAIAENKTVKVTSLYLEWYGLILVEINPNYSLQPAELRYKVITGEKAKQKYESLVKEEKSLKQAEVYFHPRVLDYIHDLISVQNPPKDLEDVLKTSPN